MQKIPEYLKDKRNELMWALSAPNQGYSPVMIQAIFNIKHLSTVTRILKSKPNDWKSPWTKTQ